MSDKNTGGPAFACAGFRDHDVSYAPQDGMTLRDYFAAKALEGMSSKPGSPDYKFEAMAAYKYADAMLKAREGGAA